MITDSELGLDITSGNIISGLELQGESIEEIDETLDLPYGERSYVENECKELTLSFKNSDNLRFNIVFRIYNHGFAFRFFVPGDNTVASIRVQNEYSQFAIHGSYQAYSESYNEWGYTLSAINNLKSLIPLTLVGDEFSLVINEAGNDSFARIALQGNENVLQSYFIGSRSSHSLPYALPWRYVVIGYNPRELAEHKEMLYALDDSDYVDENWDWVKPGKVFRCLNLTTEGALESIDFCKSMNIEYMLFDSGWCGLGYGVPNDSNPDSNPMEVVDGLDMPMITSYARENGIGVILYIDKVAWNNYDNNGMFDLYESWGIEGLKLGFVDGFSSNGIRRVYEIIEEAGRRQMVVNVHDNFRPTGLLRKYPNLLTAEGVKGNEHTSNTGNHTPLLPFTRMLTGATDLYHLLQLE